MPDCELIEAEIEYYEAAVEYDDAQITYWQAEKMADASALTIAQMMYWYYCSGARGIVAEATTVPAANTRQAILDRLGFRHGGAAKQLDRLKQKVEESRTRKVNAEKKLMELLEKSAPAK